MASASRAIAAATFILSGVTHAQQSVETVRDAAFREAERFANCLMSGNVGCLAEMTLPDQPAASGASGQIYSAQALIDARALLLSLLGYHRMEVARPWPPMAIGDSLFIFVPTFDTFGDLALRRRIDQTGYLIGVSDDGGGSWRFIVVAASNRLTLEEIEQYMPGYDDWPTPETVRIVIEDPPFERSSWLETTKSDFVAVDEAFAYTLEVGIHAELELPLDFTVSYDDPSGQGRPLRYHGSLESGQRVLQWQSPALDGFETGESYDVVIEGRDPVSGDSAFEHRQALLFQPTRELWLSDMSKPPSPNPNLASLPAAERMRDAAARAAERYASCWTNRNLLCLETLTARDQLAAAGLLEEELAQLRAGISAVNPVLPLSGYRRMEAATPWPPTAIGDDLFSFVPYAASFGPPGSGFRDDRMSYLIGVSDDGGDAWRFIQISDSSSLSPEEIDRVMPGHGEGPRPPVLETFVEERPLAQSRWVETTERGIVPVGGDFAYDMGFALRQDYEGTIDFVIRYDDPADRRQQMLYSGSMESGQRDLRWQSPALTGFETGETYEIVIEGSQAESGDRLFEHRDKLEFQPTLEIWRSVLSKPPAERSE